MNNIAMNKIEPKGLWGLTCCARASTKCPDGCWPGDRTGGCSRRFKGS